MSKTNQAEVPPGASAGEAVDTPPPARKTKLSLLLELISREKGAALEELTSATGWLPHTARAAITGLRKRGHEVRCERIDGVSRYLVGRTSDFRARGSFCAFALR